MRPAAETASATGQPAEFTGDPDAPEWLSAAHAHLLNADPEMADLARRLGPVHRGRNRESFTSLARAIVGQQISGKAASAIYNRLLALAGDPLTPAAIAAQADEPLRSCGLSVNKLLSLRDLSERALDCRLDLAHLESLPDETVTEQLVAVRGIGRWTADMFLMFSLARPDVFPAEDMGIQEAILRLYGLEKRPAPKAARALAEEKGWAPYRTAASFLLWASLAVLREPATTG